MRRFIVAMMLACGLQMAVPATSWAMTPEAAQKACDDLAAAAEQAMDLAARNRPVDRVDDGRAGRIVAIAGPLDRDEARLVRFSRHRARTPQPRLRQIARSR